ncbi:chitin binding protein [Colletotrichum orchidophilum]|uniref:Chitin binding protein n=1 Tax=Colletotrichum orchidophilum TaxID=1209926 RepID=A0A1G4BBI7_9PEZI|nr:chitin binding protein [Colletotrichum orchidophilum]OHE98733.1 chitin binding protein [Colletotrichum orchidophilum]
MRWTPVVLATLAGLEAAHAHDENDVPHPNMVLPRHRSVDDLRQRRYAFEPWNPPTVANKPRADGVRLSPRQASSTPSASSIPLGDNSQCGGTYGRCADGYCCSPSGWCGQSEAYCASPDCQINYGPACDGNERPTGADTSNIPRPQLGNIPYGGVGIYDCVNQGDVAITYDDGPYIYTNAMLDAFKAHSAVATFFITGNNIGKGMININYSDVITRMIAEGHQVASHTWSHENLDQLTLAQRQNQMIYNEIAFMDILGFFPTYMRPPYSICGAECEQQMSDLGYHITYFDLDTQGYLHTDPTQIGFSINLWDQAMLARTPCNGSYLHIEHDIHQTIATTLTNHILDSVVANGWNAVTVGTCLGDPPENWYRGNVPSYNFNFTAVSPTACPSTTSSSLTSTTTSSFSPTSSAISNSTTLPVSLDATCGAAAGNTCLGSTFGNCCSGAGYCGSTAAYCGTSCQSKYGTCGSSALNTVANSTSSISANSSSRAANSTLSSATSGRTSSSLSTTRNGTSTSSSSRTGTSSSGSSSRTGTSSSSSRTGTSSSGSSSRSGTSSSSSRTGTSSSGSSSRTGTSSSSSRTSTGSSSSSRSGTSSSGSSTRTGSSSSSSSNTRSSSGTGTASASSSAASSTSTLPVSTGGDCGATSGKQCFGSTFGNCCSVYNYCGNTPAHCGVGCQSAFGTCNSTSSSSSSTGASSSGSASVSGSATSSSSGVLPSTSVISTSGQCGAAAGQSCLGSTFGNCCSVYNYCGSTPAHCGTGCQPGYGTCNGTTVASSSAAAGGSSAANSASSVVVASGSTTANAAAATNTKISTNGECAGTAGFNCLGSNFGDCCSPYNYCGNTTAHCDTGCQSGFGKCSGTGVNAQVSLNGNCGATNGGASCVGSAFGNCCSPYGYCGSTSAFCGTGCQTGYGTCNSPSGSGTSAASGPAAT